MNDLTIPENKTLVNKEYTDDVFDLMTISTDYFPRLQLMGGQSTLVQEGKMNVGTYAYIRTRDSFENLGPDVDVLVCSWRIKAMRIGEDEVVSIFDINNPEFDKIKVESKIQNSGCMCGVEFLLWIPTQQSFATFFMASKSFARIAPSVRSCIDEDNNTPGPCSLTSKLVSNKKYKSHVPVVRQCSTAFEMPEQEDFIASLEKFQNPNEEEVESVDAKEGERPR